MLHPTIRNKQNYRLGFGNQRIRWEAVRMLAGTIFAEEFVRKIS